MNTLSVNISLSKPGFEFKVNEIFEPGVTGIFGHSGAGKTTLLQCISGLENPDSGFIKSGEKTIFSSEYKINLKASKRRIGYVFQNGRLFPHYSVQQNLLYSERFLKERKSHIDFESVVEMLEIGHLLDKYPSSISGGEQQRVALGRTLLSAPEVILLDEPFSAVDQKLRTQIIPYINRAVRKLNIPVLLVSHDLPDIVKLTDRICLIKNGKVIGHDYYEKLIRGGSLYKVLPSNEIINTVTLDVGDIDEISNIVTLNSKSPHGKINIVFEPDKHEYNVGDKVKVFLKPNDIIIASSKVNNTSFQNQIPGIVEKIKTQGPVVHVLVDCGFPLIAEVSRASSERLNLKRGNEIYCLFKSLALNSIYV